MREDIEIRTEIDPSLNAAYADPAQLESAILNLSLNAQDAMPEGGCLTITTMNVPLDERYRDMHPEVPPGHYVMIAVTDDGMGMPKDVRERAFEPFFTTKDVGKGSGLGLSMVYGFAKQSNGHVSLYSEPGLGTTIRIYLPASTSTPMAEEAKSDAELPRGHGVVLVAEDDPVVRSYAVSCLESLGYGAIATKDGNEALDMLRRKPEVAILFSDVVMPGGMTGWDLAERARELRPNLKILLTSGYAIESLASRGRINPEFAVLNKPYRKVELARRLREVLDAPR
jgi:CheY-like chemotaxis protein